MFCTFWLGNMLRATATCNFLSLILPAGSAPAALASLLFDPLEPQIIGKTQRFAFRAPASSFFWLFLFSDLLSSSLLFSDSSHLCFSICPYCRKLTSKLPSIICSMPYASSKYAWDEKNCTGPGQWITAFQLVSAEERTCGAVAAEYPGLYIL